MTIGKWVTRIGWPVAAVGAPALAVWRDVVPAHPVVAGLLFLLYEGVLAALAFAGNVVTELVGRWRARFVEWADAALGRRLSGFDRRYRESVLGNLRHLDGKGLATIGFYIPELDEVFVDVGLTLAAPHTVPDVILASDPDPDHLAGRGTMSAFVDAEKPSVVAVMGPPGVGKTSLLLHTAHQICRAPRQRRRSVPVLLFLRDHVARIVADPDVTLPDVVRNAIGRIRDSEPARWFDRCLDAGHCVVLLDGLDEVAGLLDRRAVADWVQRQISQYPRNDYVITSRPHGYLSARIDGATVLQVLRLTDEQVSDFVHAWYLALEAAIARYHRQPSGESAKSVADAVAERARAAAEDLLTRLKRAPALSDLTANPMLLTMIANVHRFRGQLPGTRVDLYREICQVMLGLRQEAKNLPVVLAGDKKELVLRGLAFDMMRRRVRDLCRADVLAAVTPVLRRVARELTAEKFLVDIAENGLLVERENGLYSFAHQTFQEYLAAAHIREKGLVGTLTDAVDDVWWRETTLLYAARSDADPVVRACLDSDRLEALTLAFDCAVQRSEIAPELRDRLEALLDSALDPDTDPQRRRLMAGVIVTRHLRQLTSAGDAARVCAQPITSGIYRLFLFETQNTPPDEPWLLDPGADEPLLGVHGREAVEFNRWVNAISGGTMWRLPTRPELDDPVVRRALNASVLDVPSPVSVWLTPHREGADPRLWTQGDCGHPHATAVTVVQEHVRADADRLTSTLARLLLVRSVVVLPALTRARAVALDSATRLDDALTRDLAGALDLAHDLDSALDLANTLALAHELDTDSARSFARSRARVRRRSLANDSSIDLTRALARMRDNEGDAAHATVNARARDTALSGDATRACQLTRDLTHDLVQDLDQARDLVRHSLPAHVLGIDLVLSGTRDLADALDGSLRRARTLDSTLRRDIDGHRTLARVLRPDGALEPFTGHLLATLLTESVRQFSAARTGDVQTLRAAFGDALVRESRLVGTEYVIAPDSLADRVRSGVSAIERRVVVSQDASSPWTPLVVARRLAEVALPVFCWQRPLTPEAAIAVRVGALCLAAETDARALPDLGDLFRQIAAGVTLVERRTTGAAPTTEAILLTVA
jgi:hypothetical protein